MRLIWLIYVVSLPICAVRAVSDSRQAKKQFMWDLNRSPPPEDDSHEVEPSQLSVQSHSPPSSLIPASLGVTRRRRSEFARKKRPNFGGIPHIEKEEECKHTPTCKHWKKLTKAQKHVVSNRIYRENNVSRANRTLMVHIDHISCFN